MGWYIRKSKKMGPVNLNLSKSGLGVSTGVKGARLSFGPKGTYVNLGRNGIYYRKKISGKKVSAVSSNKKIKKTQENYDTKSYLQGDIVKTYDNQHTATTLEQEIIKDVKKARLFFLLWIFIFVFLYNNLQQVGILISIIALIPLSYFIHPKLNFEFDDESKLEWEKTAQFIYSLKTSKKIWIVEKATISSNIKTNAGAYRNVSRGGASITLLKPNMFTGFYVKTDATTILIRNKKCKILFMPNGVLIKKGFKYFAYKYNELSVYATTTRFIENGRTARDAELVDRTWQFVNKNGSPDRRYNNNKQLPVYNYGSLLLSGNNLYIELQTSNKNVVNNVYKAYLSYVAYLEQINIHTDKSLKADSDSSRLLSKIQLLSEERKILNEANKVVRELGGGNGFIGMLEKSLLCDVEFVDGQIYQKHYLFLYRTSQPVEHKLKIAEDSLNTSSPYRCEIAIVNECEFLLNFYIDNLDAFTKELPLSDVLKNALETSEANLNSYKKDNVLINKAEKDIDNIIDSTVSNKNSFGDIKNDSLDGDSKSPDINASENTSDHANCDEDDDDFMDFFKEG